MNRGKTNEMSGRGGGGVMDGQGGTAATAAAATAANREVGRRPGCKTARWELRHEDGMAQRNQTNKAEMVDTGQGTGTGTGTGMGGGVRRAWGRGVSVPSPPKASFSLSSLS